MFSKETYKNRRSELLSKIDSGIVLLIGNGESSINFPDNWYRYRQDSTFLYYVGLNKPELMACFDVDSGKEYLVGNEVTIETVIWMGNQPSLSEMAESCGMENVISPTQLSQMLKDNQKSRTIHILPAYRSDHKKTYKQLMDLKWLEIEPMISDELIRSVVEQRNIKSADEEKH